MEYVGRCIPAIEVHVLDRARQAASTAPPCSVKSYFYDSNARVLRRSNVVLHWHQSRRQLHATSQQHAGQLQEFSCITRHRLVIICRRRSSTLIDGSRGPHYRLDITRQLTATHYQRQQAKDDVLSTIPCKISKQTIMVL